MAYQLHQLSLGIDASTLADRIQKLLGPDRQRYRRLWAYYRNPMRISAVDASDAGADRPYRQAQEWGLPSRITGVRSHGEIFAGQHIDDMSRKEVVIENDIAWRIETMCDYLFGKPLVIESAAPDPERRRAIGKLLRSIIAHNGGVVFLQQLALLGSIYGFVDVLVKLQQPEHAASDCHAPWATQDLGEPPVECASDDSNDVNPPPAGPASGQDDPSPTPDPDASTRSPHDDAESDGAGHFLQRIARMIRVEIVEPSRALPLLAADDWRTVQGYVQCYEVSGAGSASRVQDAEDEGWLARLSRLASPRRGGFFASDDKTLITEILTPTAWQRYENTKLKEQGTNTLGSIPLVHIQNTAVPFEYSGMSDVETLIPLQDELNTRLSDRASRITMQSFKMYLGVGVENFTSLPIAPGRMWMSENEQAKVIEFGGDTSAPSEDAHIADLREALDKTSGVTPIAAGAIKGRIGRLTSAAALRVTLLALLAKTDKKRTTYGVGIARICELALAWLDHAGVFRTSPDERRVELNWPSPLPENDLERLQEAEVKARLGVPKEVLLRELGY